MKELKGFATGIGSLPQKDPQAALELIFKYAPNIPFWPQLPKRDLREGMIAQFSQNLPFLKVDQAGVHFSALDAQEKELEVFYEKVISGDAEHFKITEEFSQGIYAFYQRLKSVDLKNIEFIKCHITGPFSFAAGLKDEKGSSVLHDSVFMQALAKGLTMKALWQIQLFKEFNKPMVVFIDEPYLASFGSAYTAVNREDVIGMLGETSAGIKHAEDALVGVHCCGNTDWSMLTDIKTIGIISFDAFDYLDRFVLYAQNIASFIKRGGLICWGIVPTQGFSGSETAAGLASKIKEGLDILAKKGCDRNLLLKGLLISPSCGLGTLEPEKSEKILKLLSDTSEFIRKSL